MCPSEVSDIEQAVWQRYQDQGLVVWGIGSEDPFDQLVSFRDQMGVTFPILFDDNAMVLDQYEQQRAFGGTVFPQDWIIGADGKVAYISNAYELDEMIAVIERELGL